VTAKLTIHYRQLGRYQEHIANYPTFRAAQKAAKHTLKNGFFTIPDPKTCIYYPAHTIVQLTVTQEED
jgi:hypothetical protein